VKTVHYLAGEHDASSIKARRSRNSSASSTIRSITRAFISSSSTTFRDASAIVGDKQLAWLKADLAKLRKEQPIVVLTHRPLFDLAPDWDWATRDGQTVIDALMPYSNVTVFYGTIHQETTT